jgi:hypothetical protein
MSFSSLLVSIELIISAEQRKEGRSAVRSPPGKFRLWAEWQPTGSFLVFANENGMYAALRAGRTFDTPSLKGLTFASGR